MFSAIGDYDRFKHTELDQWPQGFIPVMGDNTTGIAYNPHNPNVIMRVRGKTHRTAHENAYYSTDSGVTWTAMKNVPDIDTNQNEFLNRAAITTVNGANRFFWSHVRAPHTTFYSDDYGQTWTACTLADGGNLPGNVYLQVDSVNPLNVYAMEGGLRFFTSNDGGATFHQAFILNAKSRFVHVFDTEGKVLVAHGNVGLSVSTNANTTEPTFTYLPNVQSAYAVGVGKPITEDGPAAIFRAC